LPTAFAAPVLDGMILNAAARPPRQSFLEGRQPSLRGGSGMDRGHECFHNTPVVVEHLCTGARQFVVQDAWRLWTRLVLVMIDAITNMGVL